MLTVSQLLSSDKVFKRERQLSVLGAYVPLNVDLADPRISPLNAVSLHGLPPALIFVGKDDPVKDEAQAYARRLGADGIAVRVLVSADEVHGFFPFATAFDAGNETINEIARGLKQAFRIK